MANPYPRPMPLSTELGRPITFTSGALAGRTVRVEIEEVQKADLGRKYARKDKRSLDPPPVVLCRFFQVLETDGARVEEEIVPDQSSLGVVCHIDLFPILHGAGHGSTRTQDTPDSPNNPTSLRPPPPLLGFEGLSMASESRETTSPVSNMSPPPTASSSKVSLPFLPQQSSTDQSAARMPAPVYSYADTAPRTRLPSFSHLQGAAGRGATPHSISEPHHTQSPGVQSDEAIARFGDYTITEGSKLTEMVSGSTFTDGVVITYNGKKSVAFVFHDLAVRMEGTFVLRYRAFSVLSERRTPPTMPVLAECYGGPFKVYPSKMFPGLAPSTELTKQLSMYYRLPVKLREKERKRRKTGDDAPSRAQWEASASLTPTGDTAGAHTHASTSPTRTNMPSLPSASSSSPVQSVAWSTSTRSPTRYPVEDGVDTESGEDSE